MVMSTYSKTCSAVVWSTCSNLTCSCTALVVRKQKAVLCQRIRPTLPSHPAARQPALPPTPAPTPHVPDPSSKPHPIPQITAPHLQRRHNLVVSRVHHVIIAHTGGCLLCQRSYCPRCARCARCARCPLLLLLQVHLLVDVLPKRTVPDVPAGTCKNNI